MQISGGFNGFELLFWGAGVHGTLQSHEDCTGIQSSIPLEKLSYSVNCSSSTIMLVRQ